MIWVALNHKGEVFPGEELVIPLVEYKLVAIQVIEGWLWDLEFGLVKTQEATHEAEKPSSVG